MGQDISSRVAWSLRRAIEGVVRNEARPSEGTARVVATDADGTVWVRLPGSDVDTPANGTVTTVTAPGQEVHYRLANGRLSVTGNASSPAVGGAYVTQAVAPVAEKADEALGEAARAFVAADAAEADARRANEAANEAVEDAATANAAAAQAQADATAAGTAASAAQASATQANTAANDALTQLSTVQGVVGTVEWAATHSGQDMATYISSHLALTDAGLWVLKDASGYKVLLANDGMSVVDPQGHVVTTFGESISFSSSRPQSIGGEDAYVVFFDASGDGVPDTIRIGGNVLIGGNQTLSEVLAIVDEPTYDHSYALVGNSYTFTAHLWRGGTDVAASVDPDYFGWWLRTESGETEIGRGLTVTVPASGAGYRGTVVGGIDDVLALQIADSSGNMIVDDSGDGIETYVPLEV